MYNNLIKKRGSNTNSFYYKIRIIISDQHSPALGRFGSSENHLFRKKT